ncbi:MAG: acetyl-CoA C-acyltransferase [Deltaproteobacteria bacterium]|nr:acetyl-CoA C-acyltransferase [Deltaproteobacteria bacterium]
MEEVLIAAACRTPSGKLLGSLSSLSAPELGATVISEALKRGGVRTTLIDEVIMGNALGAGVGQNPARQSAMLAGLPEEVAAFTVNMVCASGLKAISLAASAIMLGEADTVVAGGMESMSRAPFLLRDMRKGLRYGDSKVVDSMIFDGLWDRFYNAHMGELCELTARKYKLSRETQDAFALSSHRKALEATRKGLFREEMAPVRLKDSTVLGEDETIRRDTGIKKLSLLKPVFKEGGTITAGNSPGLNDGAAALVLISAKKAKALNIKPLARVIGFSTAYTDPKWYTVAPVISVKNLLKKTGLKIEDFDLIEENEAFAAQTLAVMKELKMDPYRVNVNGGAIALGHPIGASGARILTTLVHALRNRKKSLGLATICLGGGGAMSMAIKTFK